MRIKLLFSWLGIFFATLLAQPVLAQKQTPIVNTAPETKLEKGLLWEISGNGLKKPSYLYGTIHMISSKDFFFPPGLEKKFKKAKKLVLEIDMSDQIGMAMAMMNDAVMKDNKSLSDLMSKEDYTMVKHYFETEVSEIQMVGFDRFSKFKPMVLSSMLYSKMIDGTPKMYEMEFLGMAQKEKMKVGGLETIAFQMSVFDSIPYTDQAKGIVDMVKSLTTGGHKEKDEFGKMVEVYKQQELDSLHDYSVKSEDIGNNEEVLLNRRNIDWIPKIGAIAKEQPTFFAVGAGHLGGPKGVIRLLRKAGYTVSLVK